MMVDHMHTGRQLELSLISPAVCLGMAAWAVITAGTSDVFNILSNLSYPSRSVKDQTITHITSSMVSLYTQQTIKVRARDI
jgi:hypothetical protein